MPRDAPQLNSAGETETAERVYRCARCAALVTRERWAIAPDGAHERAFFNPAGVVFRVLCFKEAPGAVAVGSPTADFTWFRGYGWSLALCIGCGGHLGWRYEGEGPPAVFFGLIKGALIAGAE